jgi:hypothetical protein
LLIFFFAEFINSSFFDPFRVFQQIILPSCPMVDRCGHAGYAFYNPSISVTLAGAAPVGVHSAPPFLEAHPPDDCESKNGPGAVLYRAG